MKKKNRTGTNPQMRLLAGQPNRNGKIHSHDIRLNWTHPMDSTESGAVVDPTRSLFDNHHSFMCAHWKAKKEFQVSLPANITKSGRCPWMPANGMVVTTDINSMKSECGGWLMNFLESTLLGGAAGTKDSRQRTQTHRLPHAKAQEHSVRQQRQDPVTVGHT